MKLHSLRLWAVLMAPLFLSACNTMQTMPDEEYLKLSADDQTAYQQETAARAEALQAKKDVEYDAGLPVHYNAPNDGFTLQWVKKLDLVAVCKGHTTGMMGIETSMCAVTRADENGKIHMQNINGVQKPTMLLTNTTSQQGLGRLLIEGGFKVLSAGVNGALAAQIRSDGCSEGGCGNTTLINAGGNSSAAALSEAASGSSAVVDFKVDGCADASCGGAF